MSGRPAGRSPRNLALGVFRLARFDARGMAEFGGTTEAFLASLAPLIAFPLVGAGLLLARGTGLEALAEFLATLCTLLAPPVLSHVFAVLWRRESEWLAYATAFNWCQWAIPAAAALLLASAGVLVATGVPNRAAALVALGALVLYGLAMHWFIARTGLRLSALRAAILVLAVNLGTGLLVVVPLLLAAGGREG